MCFIEEQFIVMSTLDYYLPKISMIDIRTGIPGFIYKPLVDLIRLRGFSDNFKVKNISSIDTNKITHPLFMCTVLVCPKKKEFIPVVRKYRKPVILNDYCW